MKPIVIRKVGRAWEVWIDLPVARARMPRRAHRKIAEYGDADALAVTRPPGGSLRLSASGPAERFTKKEDARHVAHQIGRYLLDLGDFVSTYTEGY